MLRSPYPLPRESPGHGHPWPSRSRSRGRQANQAEHGSPKLSGKFGIACQDGGHHSQKAILAEATVRVGIGQYGSDQSASRGAFEFQSLSKQFCGHTLVFLADGPRNRLYSKFKVIRKGRSMTQNVEINSN